MVLQFFFVSLISCLSHPNFFFCFVLFCFVSFSLLLLFNKQDVRFITDRKRRWSSRMVFFWKLSGVRKCRVCRHDGSHSNDIVIATGGRYPPLLLRSDETMSPTIASENNAASIVNVWSLPCDALYRPFFEYRSINATRFILYIKSSSLGNFHFFRFKCYLSNYRLKRDGDWRPLKTRFL